MEIQGKTQQLRKLFNRYPSIKLVYFFGSRATKKQAPLSDFDFAVYLAETIISYPRTRKPRAMPVG